MLHFGTIGVPRHAAAGTFLGFGSRWAWEWSDLESRRQGSLYLYGHVAINDSVEVGVDLEVLQDSFESNERGERADTDFGFLVPRVKVVPYSGDLATVALGLGILLPTSTNDLADTMTMLAFEPAVYAALRPVSFLSVTASLPFPIALYIPDGGENSVDGLFEPSVGVAVMPLEYIGGFAQLQFKVWLDAGASTRDGAEPDALKGMNVVVGLRTHPMSFFLAELAAIVPVAGAASDMFDVGVALRLGVTPDLF